MKTLKTIMIMAVTLALCVSLLGGCQQSGIGSGGNDVTTTTQAATTTTEATTTTKATTTTTEPAVVYTINEDRLAEIGKTFAEIKELYGDSPIGWNYNGGKIYAFEEAGCSYYFGIQDDRSVPPAEDALCQKIFHLYAEKLFNGLTEAISPTELAEMYRLEHLWSKWTGFFQNDPDGEYMSLFRYGDYEILIPAHEDYMIKPNTKIESIKIAEE